MAECLVKAFQREMLEPDNQASKIKYARVVYTMSLYLFRCQKLTDASKDAVISKTSDLLIIQLKRWESHSACV